MTTPDNQKCQDARILFWNARSVKNKKNELQIIGQDYDVIFLVETWLKDGDNFYFDLPGYSEYKCNRQYGDGGGIAFLIRNTLRYSAIDDLVNSNPIAELAGIRITNLSQPVAITACYRPPGYGNRLAQEEWDDIASNTSTCDKCILVGDFNAHNEAWNCASTDDDGLKLLDAAEKHNLIVHNLDSLTHIDFARGNKSNLDLVFSTTDAAAYVHTRTFEDSMGSDHFPISITVDISRSIYHRKSFKVQSKRTNWIAANAILETEYKNFLDHVYEELSPTERYDYFVKVVTNAVSLATPKKKMVHETRHRNPVTWWDADCDRAKRLRQCAYKKWDFSRKQEDLETFRKLKRDARKLFTSKKRECFRKFAETINLNANTKYTWQKVKILKNKWTKTKVYSRSQHLDKNIEIEDTTAKLCPPWVESNTDEIFKKSCDNPFFDRPFTYSEFNIALASRGNKSAPGLDGLNYEVLHNIPIKFHLLLLDILNALYANKAFPESWRDSFIHFVDKASGTGLRPLALTSCCSKLFELMVSNRLRHWVETRNLLPSSQKGFRKGMSCADNLTTFKLDVDDALDNNEQVMAVFLDVTNAFNNVNIDILLEKLIDIGCSTQLVHFVKHMTHSRRVYTEVNMDNPRSCFRGVLQGGVLSPLLYTLYVADIASEIQDPVKCLQYADDIVIYMRTHDAAETMIMLQNAIKSVTGKLTDIGLDVAPGKTECILFNRQNITPGSTTIQVQDKQVKTTAHVKFLGVYFDYNMSFGRHQAHVLQKAGKAMNILKFTRGTYWGAHPGSLLSLFKSFVRPIIDYAIFIYMPSQDTRILKLERLQYSAIRLALGLRRSTPTNVLLAESKLLSIRHRSRLLCLNFLIKLMSKSESATLATILRYLPTIIEDKRKKINTLRSCIKSAIGLRHMVHSDRLTSPYNFDYEAFRTPASVDLNFGRKLADNPSPNHLFKLRFSNEDAILVYTDGSKDKYRMAVGSACVCPELNYVKTRSVNPKASVYTAECLALADAMEIALAHKDRDINIFSDSLSALMTLSRPALTDNMNHYILVILQRNAEFHKNNALG